MKKKTVWTMKCPKCNSKIKVTVEPFTETTRCLECRTKLKVVKKLLFVSQSFNPALPNKSHYTYELQILDE